MPDLTALDLDVRWLVYRTFGETGRAPSLADLASGVDRDAPDVAASLERLQQAHALVLAPGTCAVWMAHPFSATPTAYGFTFNHHRYWANCAWDFFALATLVGMSGAFSVRCAQSGAALGAAFDRGTLVRADGVLHFTVPPRRFWENVAFT